MPRRTTEPFSLVRVAPHPFGVLALVSLPGGKEPVARGVLARLDPDEAAVARARTGYRHVEWVGGRLAAREAAARLGASSWCLLSGSSKEPLPPPGFVVSISHKRDLAVALVARSTDALAGGLGVDVEDDVAAARAAADIVLVREERSSLERLPPVERARAFVLAFALKECVYKALAVRVRRPLAYREAFVRIDSGGPASVTIALEGRSRQPQVEVAYEWLGTRVIAAVRVRERTP